MQEEELKAYQGLKKQGTVLLKFRIYGLVLFSTKQPNVTIMLPFRIPVTTKEYLNRKHYFPEYYKGPNILERQIEYYQQDSISS